MSTVGNLALKESEKNSGTDLGLDRIDDVSDFFLWDDVSIEKSVENSWCNLGATENVLLMGTAMVEYGCALLSHIRKEYPSAKQFAFNVTFDGKERRYRAQRTLTVTGVVIALRRIGTVPVLENLRLPKWLPELFLQQAWVREGGLVLMAAPTGSGKSTTIAAVIRARLEKFGGHARTAEDPVELPLHGMWGNGMCLQSPVDTDSDSGAYGKIIREFLRDFPASDGAKIIFVGEVRDGEVAAEAIKAAISGHLVITTIHAESPGTAIQRLFALAAAKMQSETVAADMLGSALRVSIVQRLAPNPSKALNAPKKLVEADVLMSTGGQHAVGINIRDRKFHMLDAVQDRQKNLMTAMDPRTVKVEDLIKQTGGKQ